jgi:hypothetical protein
MALFQNGWDHFDRLSSAPSFAVFLTYLAFLLDGG